LLGGAEEAEAQVELKLAKDARNNKKGVSM